MLSLFAALLQSTPLYYSPPPYDALSGPRALCAEYFSVRLEAGETMGWTRAPGFTGGISHILLSRGKLLQVGPWQGRGPPQGGRRVRLQGSRAGERLVTDLRRLPQLRGPDGRHLGADYRVSYLLYDDRHGPVPLSVSLFTDNPREFPSIVQRIRRGTMAERHCSVAARLDPALTGGITQIWPYGGGPRQ